MGEKDTEKLRQVIEVLKGDKKEEGLPLLGELDQKLQAIRMDQGDYDEVTARWGKAKDRQEEALAAIGESWECDFIDLNNSLKRHRIDLVRSFCPRLTSDYRLNMRTAELLVALAEERVYDIHEVPWQVIFSSPEDAPRTAVGVLLQFHDDLKERGLITEPERAPAAPVEEAPFAVKEGVCELIPGEEPLTISVAEEGKPASLVHELLKQGLISENLAGETEVEVSNLDGLWLEAVQGSALLLLFSQKKGEWGWVELESQENEYPVGTNEGGAIIISLGEEQNFLITRVEEGGATWRGSEARIELTAVKLTDRAPLRPGEKVEEEVALEEGGPPVNPWEEALG